VHCSERAERQCKTRRHVMIIAAARDTVADVIALRAD
jgi:hypothetical protein